MDLLTHSPALAYIEKLLGSLSSPSSIPPPPPPPSPRILFLGQINMPRAGQIALRYPGDGCLIGSVEKFTGPAFVNALTQNPLIGEFLSFPSPSLIPSPHLSLLLRSLSASLPPLTDHH